MDTSPYLLGYDIGSSSVKATLLHAQNGEVVASATYPKKEMAIDSPKPGWAEQDPEVWWENVKHATKELLHKSNASPERIEAIGISYQMHGLVTVDKNLKPLRPSIIWCDSRAVETGNKAFEKLGPSYCLKNFLNSPGNFTASKLKWVKDNEPEVFKKIYKSMLPGEYIAMKLSGEIHTTVSGLSEGIYWNFKEARIAEELLNLYDLPKELLPEVKPVFSVHSIVSAKAAAEIGLAAGTKIAYRAGDQPNNAFSLNVLNPGEVGATAGTSGAVYGILDIPSYDPESRVNTFVHVNHTQEKPRYGVLLCVNGTGILNNWLRKLVSQGNLEYDEMNKLAAKAPIGSEGLVFLPFGNGAERILVNRELGGQLQHLDFNRHSTEHVLRAGQEGIVSALAYGFSIMNEMGVKVNTVKAGFANMFMSPIFREAFSNMTGATIELYNTDGSQGAARGAGIGAGIYSSFDSAFEGLKKIGETIPDKNLTQAYQDVYGTWLNCLNENLNT